MLTLSSQKLQASWLMIFCKSSVMRSLCSCTHLASFVIRPKFSRYVLLALFFVGLLVEVQAQRPEIIASVDSNEILIGDHLTLNILVSHAPGQHIFWPFWLDSLGGFEILDKSSIDSTERRGQLEEVQQLILTTFDSGFYEIPSLPFRYTQENSSDTLSLGTQVQLIEVHGIAVDTTQAIKPIKSLLDAPLTFREILPWLVVGVIGLLLIGGLVYWFFIRKKAEPIFAGPPPPTIPPHEIAMKKFAQLEQKKLWQEGEIKTYYVELTEIIREYLEGRYKVPALESTTDEIMGGLTSKGIPVFQFNQLKDLLIRADFTKFAKLRPGPSENMMSMEVARTFVKETRNFELESDDAVTSGSEAPADVSQ